MKKLVSMITIFLILFIMLFSAKVYAAALDTMDITVDKQTLHPGENVKVTVAFGQQLGSYTVDIAYDNNLLEYVSSEGGTHNDNGTRIRLYYFDSTGGTQPRENMSVTFKAKEGIITSNPTDFSITAEGLANPDGSVEYDDITVPIVKNVIVEPIYEDYKIQLDYTGDIIENEPKEMKITISSAMGKNYEHARLLAEATTPSGATVKLLATDNAQLEHDIIQSGWGDASGSAIGGKEVSQQLNVRGLFSAVGEYSITLKLIDRDHSDAEITKQTFALSVKEKAAVLPPNTEETPPTTPETDNQQPENNRPENNENKEELPTEEIEPTTLPKTGHMIYLTIVPIMMILAVIVISCRKK